MTIAKRTYDRLKQEASAWRAQNPRAELGYVCEFCGKTEHKPNKETRAALRVLRDPGKLAKLKSYSSSNEMLADILGKDLQKHSSH